MSVLIGRMPLCCRAWMGVSGWSEDCLGVPRGFGVYGFRIITCRRRYDVMTFNAPDSYLPATCTKFGLHLTIGGQTGHGMYDL